MRKKKNSGTTIHSLVIRSAVFVSIGVTILLLGITSDFSMVEASAQLNPVNESTCQVSQRYPKAVRQWCGLITDHANEHNLPPDLIAAVIWLESGGDPLAYSRSGAVGLMQVMPRDGLASAFMCPAGPCFANRPSIAELENPDFNIAYGTRMLAGLYGRTGSLRDALFAYGPMDVGYSYADRILDIFERYRSD